MAEFKAGDMVRCIDPLLTTHDKVRTGEKYRVEAIRDGWVIIEGGRGGWLPNRFELVARPLKPAPTTPAPDAGGTKHDDGKPPMALLDGLALLEVAKVLAFGAKKYAPDNWRKGFTWRRLISAALRHTFAFAGGEDLDPETGICHLAHAMCCLMFLLNHWLTKLGTDDRFKREVAP